jgi:hypothetical protein
MSNYYVRENCIICNSKLKDNYLTTDLSIPLCCYLLDNIEKNNGISIPYNVYICGVCKTSQTKYLGDLNLIYSGNHADSTGSIMKNLHYKVKDVIKKHIIEINNITEIGSSYGILSDIVLDELGNNIKKYYIIEPCFKGQERTNKIIINDFFENVDYNNYGDSNTILISHVFEHFYNPIEIMKKISDNKNIENIILVWPDLEYYKDNNVYHVLNTEHTFYVDNNLIKTFFNNNCFELIEEIKYKNHSVIFVFKKNKNLSKLKLQNINYKIDDYFNFLLNKKEEILLFINENKKNNKEVCIWPASVHTQFFLMLLNSPDVDFVLDNSPNKIGKYLYGHNLKCKSFTDSCNKDNAIILNGGCFNKEVLNLIEQQKVEHLLL